MSISKVPEQPDSDRPLRAAIYTRVSTSRQADEGLSLPAQDKRCRAYAEVEFRKWEVVGVYVERGVSGAKASRPKLDRLLDAIDAGGIDVLITPAFDRLSRSVVHLFELYERLQAANVALVSVDDGVDTTRPGGENNLIILGAVAQIERNNIKERVAAAHTERRAKGLHNGRAAYGYAKGKGDDKGRFIPDPAERPIIERIVDEWLGGKSQLAIAQDLNRDGVPTRSGKEWDQGYVSLILRNHTYAGMTRDGKQKCPCGHEAIIDAEKWARAQALLGGRHNEGGPNRRTAAGHLFLGGYLTCGLCGHPLAPRTDKRHGYNVYQCTRRRKEKITCAAPTYHRDELETALVEKLTDRHVDAKAMIARHDANIGKRMEEVVARRKEAERAAIRADDRLSRVERYFHDGRISPEDWTEQKATLGEEKQAAAENVRRLAEQERELKRTLNGRDAEAEVLEFLAGLKATLLDPIRDAESMDAMRVGFRSLWQGLTVYPAGSAEAKALSDNGDRAHVVIPVNTEGDWGAPPTEPSIALPTPANTYSQGLTR